MKLNPVNVPVAEGKPENLKSLTKELTESDTSEEEQVNPSHRLLLKEENMVLYQALL